MIRADGVTIDTPPRGGLTVGLVEQGELVWTHSIGSIDDTAKRPATRDSIYPIASMTKMVTGIMLLQLVERGSVLTSYEFDGTSKTGVILLANTYAGQASYKVMVRRILALLNPASPGGSGLAELEQH